MSWEESLQRKADRLEAECREQEAQIAVLKRKIHDAKHGVPQEPRFT